MLNTNPETKMPKHPAEFLMVLQAEKDYVPAAETWYTGKYLWDICFSSIVYAESGYPYLAESNLFSLLRGQRSDGMVPNCQPDPNGKNRFTPERWLFNDFDLGSDYTQPMLLGRATLATYYAFLADNKRDQARQFLTNIYDSLAGATNFVLKNRTEDNGSDLIAKIIHPCESGRDSDPNFDGIKPRIARNGKETHALINLANPLLDYAGVSLLGIKNRLSKWDQTKTKERFWYSDPMFASIFAKHLADMAEIAKILGKNLESDDYLQMYQEASRQIQEKMWFVYGNSGIFRVLNTANRPVQEVSITSLCPAILPDLSAKKLQSLIKLFYGKFNTRFPVPTVAIDSPNYDPGYQEKMIMWRGPTWIWMNYLLASGFYQQTLRKDLDENTAQACQHIAERIFISSRNLTKPGYHEHYDPEFGTAQRTPNFAGSALGQLPVKSFFRDYSAQAILVAS